MVAASDPAAVGQPAALGASDALTGRGWIGDVEHDGDRGGRRRTPRPHADGAFVGVVVAEEAYPSLGDRLTGAGGDLALYLGLGALLGVAGTYLVSRVVSAGRGGSPPPRSRPSPTTARPCCSASVRA